MTTPIWVRVTSSPASGPASVPTPGQPIQPKDNRIKAHSPREAEVVWFLGDIYQVRTHFGGGTNTLPCMGDECVLCSTPNNAARTNGFAAALIRNGQTPEGEEVWLPRVLRVYQSNFGLGDNLRGRVYRVKQISGKNIKGGLGACSKWQYTFSHTKTPPVEEFDVEAVMNSYWFPAKHKPVYLDDQRVAPRPRPAAAAEPTFADSLKVTPSEKLLELLTAYRHAGVMPKQADAIEAELHTRGVILDTDADAPAMADHDDLTAGQEPAPGRFKLVMAAVPMPNEKPKVNGRHGKPTKGGAL